MARDPYTDMKNILPDLIKLYTLRVELNKGSTRAIKVEQELSELCDEVARLGHFNRRPEIAQDSQSETPAPAPEDRSGTPLVFVLGRI
jgi:hypothetical protein